MLPKLRRSALFHVLHHTAGLYPCRPSAGCVQVLKRPHYLLVTLVLCNAAATEVGNSSERRQLHDHATTDFNALQALPIVLDRLADPYTAVLLSIVVVLFFGEIVPQALCSRYGLAIGAYSSTFVRVLMLMCGIIAYPISLVLDFLLGKEHSVSTALAAAQALESMSAGAGLTQEAAVAGYQRAVTAEQSWC